MKEKPVPTSPKYRDKYKKAAQKTSSGKNHFFLVIILAIVFGLVAGFFAQIILSSLAVRFPENYFFQKLTIGLIPFSHEVVIKKTVSSTDRELKILEALESTSPQMVKIFTQKESGSDLNLLSQIYLDGEEEGQGIVLTSDGWLLTTSQVINDLNKKYVVVTQNREIYPAFNILVDSVANLVFLKIEAEDLSVAKFTSRDNIEIGQEVLALKNSVGGGENVILTQIESKNSFFDPKELVKSSEKLNRLIKIKDKLENSYQGAPLIDLEGQVMGVCFSDNKEELKQVIPSDYFLTLIEGVLKNNKIKRVYLGINYLDLSESLNFASALKFETEPEKGALVYGDNQLSVIVSSPADKSGLEEGDIILKINELEVNQNQDLSSLIQGFESEETVKVTILREGEEKVISVKLEKLE